MDEAELKAKLRKIETLYAGAATPGERAAAGAAAERIKEHLKRLADKEPPTEMQFNLRNLWSHRLFVALCRRYDIRPYRYRRMRYTSVCARAPRSFLENVLWPEFQELDAALGAHLSEITDRIICEEVHKDAADADEVDEPLKIGKV